MTTMFQPNVTALHEKAMLVKLTTRRANLNRRDTEAEAVLQATLGDAGLTANRKLFRDKHNPINQMMTAVSEVYTYHREHTLPYIDKGPRILPNTQYDDYTKAMRERIDNLDGLMQRHLPQYALYVQMDIDYRSGGAAATTKRANVADYPTVDQFKASMGFDLRFSPLPDAKHFLFDISDHDMQVFMDAQADALRAANEDVVLRMLEPLQHLVAKLGRPIGTEGSVFRDSAVQNVTDGLEMARRLAIDPSPALLALMDGLHQDLAKLNTTWLRESPTARHDAARRLDQIARQMGGFMQAL